MIFSETIYGDQMLNDSRKPGKGLVGKAGILLALYTVLLLHPFCSILASSPPCSTGKRCTSSTPMPFSSSASASGTFSASIDPPIINNRNAITLTARNETISFQFLTYINDARNSGAGWHVIASATPLTFGNSNAKSDLFLDAITPVTVTCAASTKCSSLNPLILASSQQDLITPTRLITAPLTSGLGGYNITTFGHFFIPANAYAGQTTGGVLSITVASTP